MIATIKSEWRKNRFRPAFLVGSGLIAGLTGLAYSVNWYQSTHPSSAAQAAPLATLYPDQFVGNVLGAGFPLGAAMAIVLGALIAGSDYGWGTLKTTFTQGPGRLTAWLGRVAVFTGWMAILTVVLFSVGAAYSAVIAVAESHSITWPAASEIVKAAGAMWLILTVNGAIGLALGVVIRQSAAALGVGIVYLLSVEIIAVRFIDGLNNGAYRWIGDLFVGQNATALLSSLVPGPGAPAAITATQAVLVLFAYLIGLVGVAAALLRLRDVT